MRWGNALDYEVPDWFYVLKDHFIGHRWCIKVNYSHSLILNNLDTDEYVYFHSSENNARMLEYPATIYSEDDFFKFIDGLETSDPLEWARTQRPNTKWEVVCVVATTFYFHRMHDYPIGSCCSDIAREPQTRALFRNRGVNLLINNPVTKTAYKDSLCFFRCLARHEGSPLHDLDEATLKLYDEWSSQPVADFKGVTMADLEPLETKFNVSIDVFEVSQNEEHKDVICPLRRSTFVKAQTKRPNRKRTANRRMRVLLVGNHFAYIHCLPQAAKCFSCRNCGKLWKTFKTCERHAEKCTGERSKNVYPGGVYTPKRSALEILNDAGHAIPTDYVFPYFITWDFEAMLTPVQEAPPSQLGSIPRNTATTNYSAKHIPFL